MIHHKGEIEFPSIQYSFWDYQTYINTFRIPELTVTFSYRINGDSIFDFSDSTSTAYTLSAFVHCLQETVTENVSVLFVCSSIVSSTSFASACSEAARSNYKNTIFLFISMSSPKYSAGIYLHLLNVSLYNGASVAQKPQRPAVKCNSN